MENNRKKDDQERGDEREKRLEEKVERGVRDAEKGRNASINGKIPGVQKELIMMMCQCREDPSLLGAKD